MANEDLLELLKEVSEAIGDLDAPLPEKNGTQNETQKVKKSVEGTAFPTEMPCGQVFDQLLKCYSIGGQIRHYYRHGELSYCTDKKDQLKFCLKSKLNTEEVRKEKVSQFYKERLAHQMAQRQTSEQIWDSRSEPLRRPFREDSEEYINESSN